MVFNLAAGVVVSDRGPVVNVSRAAAVEFVPKSYPQLVHVIGELPVLLCRPIFRPEINLSRRQRLRHHRHFAAL